MEGLKEKLNERLRNLHIQRKFTDQVKQEVAKMFMYALRAGQIKARIQILRVGEDVNVTLFEHKNSYPLHHTDSLEQIKGCRVYALESYVTELIEFLSATSYALRVILCARSGLSKTVDIICVFENGSIPFPDISKDMEKVWNDTYVYALSAGQVQSRLCTLRRDAHYSLEENPEGLSAVVFDDLFVMNAGKKVFVILEKVTSLLDWTTHQQLEWRLCSSDPELMWVHFVILL
jgi:hypothetical protein